LRYRVHGVIVDSAIAIPEIPQSRAAFYDVRVELDGVPADRPLDWFHAWPARGQGTVRKKPWLSFGRHDEGYVLRFPELADFDVSASGDRIRCRPAGRLAKSTLRHLLIDQVLPLALSRAGHLVLHASAVHVPRLGAIAFAGQPGFGKSTIAGALGLCGCRVITDDCLVVVRRSSNDLLAVPGYPGLRLWRSAARALGLGARGDVAHYTAKRRLDPIALSFRDRPSSLKALFVLGRRLPRSRPSSADLLHARDRLMAVAPYAFLMDVAERAQLSAMFGALTHLVTEVPVVRLRLRDDPRRLLRTAEEVIALARASADP